MFNRFCLLLLALLFPSYCFAAKPAPVPMPVAEELQIEMVEPQQEIAVVVPATAQAVGMQFGLIGAIIGSAVQNSQVKKAEERIVPVRDLLVEYPFGKKMEAALREKITAEGLSPAPLLTVVGNALEAHDAEQSATGPSQALVLLPGYSMDNDFSRMTVSLRATLVDRSVKPNGKIKVTPRFGHAYSFQFPLQGERSEDPVQDWLAFEGAGIAQLLDQGIAQVTDMLVQDFSPEGRAAWETKVKKESAVVNGNVYPGLPVRQGEGWAWVRNGRGFLQTVQGFQPLTAGMLPALAATSAAPAAVVAAAESASDVAATEADGVAPALEPAADAAPVSNPVAPEAQPAAQEPVQMPEAPAAVSEDG